MRCRHGNQDADEGEDGVENWRREEMTRHLDKSPRVVKVSRDLVTLLYRFNLLNFF